MTRRNAPGEWRKSAGPSLTSFDAADPLSRLRARRRLTYRTTKLSLSLTAPSVSHCASRIKARMRLMSNSRGGGHGWVEAIVAGSWVRRKTSRVSVSSRATRTLSGRRRGGWVGGLGARARSVQQSFQAGNGTVVLRASCAA